MRAERGGYPSLLVTHWRQRTGLRLGERLVFVALAVAVLYQAQLRPVISIVRIEEHARHMWVRVSLLAAHLLFIAVCYFPLDTSSYARQVTTKGHNPYETLHAHDYASLIFL